MDCNPVLEALGIADPLVKRLGSPPPLLTWHSGSTDAQLLADVKDLVQAMADATCRTLTWKHDDEFDQMGMRPVTDSVTSCLRNCIQSTPLGRMLCGGKLTTQFEYSLFIACEPVECSDVACYMQRALGNKLGVHNGPVVQEVGPMIDRSSIDSVLAGIYRSRALLLLEPLQMILSG